MPTIIVKFVDHTELELSIDNNSVGQKYFNLVRDNYKNQKPIHRDRPKYTVEYMLNLAEKAKNLLGWEWEAQSYSIKNTKLLHKDLEILLGKVGFSDVSAEHDELFHELHFCLHNIQFLNKNNARRGWLQIEWYNNSMLPLDEDFNFITDLKFGDIKLQNPFVGHGPLQVYVEQDFTNISQTCKFHNIIRPGINIVIEDFPIFQNSKHLIEIFKKFDPIFVSQHGEDKILKYTGYPVVGKIINLDTLEQIVKSCSSLDLEFLKFYD